MPEQVLLTLIFSEKEPARIQCLADRTSDPNHPQYGEHLDREQLRALVALPDDERSSVVTWLASQGMVVIDPPAGNRQLLFVRATTEQIKAAFGEEIYCWLKKDADQRGVRISSAMPRRLAG